MARGGVVRWKQQRAWRSGEGGSHGHGDGASEDWSTRTAPKLQGGLQLLLGRSTWKTRVFSRFLRKPELDFEPVSTV